MKSITSSLKNKIGISFCAALGLAGHSLMPLHVRAQSTTRWPNTVNVSYGSKSYTLNAVGNIAFQDFTNQGLFTATYSPWAEPFVDPLTAVFDSKAFANLWLDNNGLKVTSDYVCGSAFNPCTPDFIYFSGAPQTEAYLGYLSSPNGLNQATGNINKDINPKLYFAYAMKPINSESSADNISSNLPGQNPIPMLLPKFQGGVLSPSRSDPQRFVSVNDDFLVSSSTANSIDSAGKFFSLLRQNRCEILHHFCTLNLAGGVGGHRRHGSSDGLWACG